MITMVDEIYDRHYQEGRAQLNDAIGGVVARLGKAVGNAFNVLNRIEYNAPWASHKKTIRRV